MKYDLELVDPISGAAVRIGVAELHQRCPDCGEEMLGKWVGSTETTGWHCLRHLQTTILTHNASDRGLATAAAREQLSRANVGDTVTVTRQLLAAVGFRR